jgi:hypothetical protein
MESVGTINTTMVVGYCERESLRKKGCGREKCFWESDCCVVTRKGGFFK